MVLRTWYTCRGDGDVTLREKVLQFDDIDGNQDGIIDRIEFERAFPKGAVVPEVGVPKLLPNQQSQTPQVSQTSKTNASHTQGCRTSKPSNSGVHK